MLKLIFNLNIINNLIYKMEGLSKKLDRVQSDVDKIIDLYDYAEKLYPYEKIRDARQVHLSFVDSNYR